MSIEPVDARVQFQALATFGARIFLDKTQQLGSESLGAGLLVSNKVVHVAKVSPGKTVQKAKTRDSRHFVLKSNEGETIALLELLPHNRNEFSRWNVRPQLNHHTPASCDF